MNNETKMIICTACIALILGFAGGFVASIMQGGENGQSGDAHYEKVTMKFTEKSYYSGDQLTYQIEFKASADGYVHVQNYESETDKHVTDICFHEGKNVIMLPWINMNYKPILTFYERH